MKKNRFLLVIVFLIIGFIACHNLKEDSPRNNEKSIQFDSQEDKEQNESLKNYNWSSQKNKDNTRTVESRDKTTKKEEPTTKDDFNYKDGFAVVTYKDLELLQKRDDFTDVYLVATISNINEVNDITVIDEDGGKWTVDASTDRDFSAYIGTVCEIYGFSSGGISNQHDTPLINMNHDNNRIIFFDGKEFNQNTDYTLLFDRKDFSDSEVDTNHNLVWIPTNGGTKYHCRSNCSNMEDPLEVYESEAIARGFSKCNKCW